MNVNLKTIVATITATVVVIAVIVWMATQPIPTNQPSRMLDVYYQKNLVDVYRRTEIGLLASMAVMPFALLVLYLRNIQLGRS